MKKEKIEVGDFITYRNLLMAIVAINDETVYALCNDNHKMAKFNLDDSKVEIKKKAACKHIVQAFYDDMTNLR